MRQESSTAIPCSALLVALWLWPAVVGAQSSRIEWDLQREQMVDRAIVEAGIANERVIRAMRDTRRHEFVPLAQRRLAYRDMALPIGAQQTISPPFVVAYMTERLDPQRSDRVLEIGTGSGYQAAVLSHLVREVYSIEIVPSLGRKAARALKRHGCDNVKTKVGDGYLGWPEAAPFDKIIVTCSPEEPPMPLVEQLAEGGLMVIPVGERYQQNLYLMRKERGRLVREELQATLFVPMTGEAEDLRERQPTPSRPSIFNGGFERVAEGDTDRSRPAGWHYLRSAELERVADGLAPEGENTLAFTNDEPGYSSQALQGFAVDGRKVSRLRITFTARGQGIRFGSKPNEWPYVVVTYYDGRRAALADEAIGPLRGDFPWTEFDEVVSVPIAAREAILRIGLLGAVGRLELDDMRVSKAD